MNGEKTMRSEYRPLDKDESEAIAKVKYGGAQLFDYIEDELERAFGTSREFSLAKTKIEEAVMWAVKGLTR